ncbi:hypothetical protein KP79_PYT11037 [Mizuhopecten yessoensis]|uniref:Uncharacterized protein n=1 Tax=Mizuhopecten yessoensis TaxID=6573 RepID=A0A210PZS2_MIZYE|nr:hypothetical protein KP79_PYT11037 [Mizuhopecten yessoensis]
MIPKLSWNKEEQGYISSSFMRNKNTARKTQSDIKIFTDYLMSHNEWRSPESIDSVQLADYMARSL